MNKVVSIKFEWTYEPIDYLEEPISISSGVAQLSIGNGKAEALVDPNGYENKPNIKDELTSIVKSRLDAVQLLTHREYSLARPIRTDLREDGKRDIYLETKPAASKLSPRGEVDFIHKDKDGNILYDSKQDRLTRQKWFADTVSRFRSKDSTLEQLLLSYQHAVQDPDNELLYLYEIRDAISSKFGGKQNSLKQLSISINDWNMLGELANSRNIVQSRHRGKFADSLRNARESELESARKIAVLFIEKYLLFLEMHLDE